VIIVLTCRFEGEAMAARKSYKAIVIGAGQGGSPLATGLAQEGWKTALIEKEHIGGTCVNEGCTPTKTMIASARVAYLAQRGADYGLDIPSVRVDMARIRERKRQIVRSFREGSESRVRASAKLDLFMGSAAFTGINELTVTMNDGTVRTLRSDKIFINTGTRPGIPSIEGIDSIPYLTSTSIMELDSIPGHLLIIGGGYIGLEFGQMFRRFGSDVTIIHRGKQLLTREDPDIAGEMLKIISEDGIDVLLESNPTAVKLFKGSWIELAIQTGSVEKNITGSHLLIAAGRVPNTDDLKTEEAGITLDKRGFVKVNERLETAAPGIYALGDVKGGPAFTHISYDDYRILFANLVKGENRTTKNRDVPYTVFTDPQLGRVGTSEREARSNGIHFTVFRLPMNHVARSLEVDETRGVIKALVDTGTGRILGAAVLGIEGGELMAVLQMAMMGGVSYTAVRDAVYAHPTLAESLNNLFMSMDG
jgi:pyruvate/2-oxoglutarate dehydrogenase complex dihydrolipoamide dehydrogenase (E3) component